MQVELAKRGLMRDLGERLKGRVQFEADVLPYLEWERLSAGKAKLVPTHGIVDEVRAVKDEDEVARLQRAARIADRGLEALTAETWIGHSEREIAWRLRELLHAHGADELSFDSIVASGENGARPHAHPTDRIIERGTLVTVDWGVRVDGYCSDCTRTFSTGKLPDRLREAYDVCLAAQQHACANIKAGHDRHRGRRARPRADRRRRVRRELRPRPRARRRPADPRGAAALDRVDRHARGRALRDDRARASTCRGSAACGSRISRSSATTASTC